MKIQTYVAFCFATFLVGFVASVGHAEIQFRQPKDPGPGGCLDSRFPCDAQGAGSGSGGGGGFPGSPNARCWVCGMDASNGITFRCKKADAGYSGCYIGANGCKETLPSCRPDL